MAKYSEDNKCSKCGGAASSRYDSSFGLNYIKRVCSRCGYEWLEEPLDTKETLNPIRNKVSNGIKETENELPHG